MQDLSLCGMSGVVKSRPVLLLADLYKAGAAGRFPPFWMCDMNNTEISMTSLHFSSLSD